MAVKLAGLVGLVVVTCSYLTLFEVPTYTFPWMNCATVVEPLDPARMVVPAPSTTAFGTLDKAMFSRTKEPERKVRSAVEVWRKMGVFVTVASRIDSEPIVWPGGDS